MEFKYTIYDYPEDALYLKINLEGTEFFSQNKRGRAIVTPYYRNKSTNNMTVKGRTCKKAIFKSSFGRKSIMWDGLNVNLDKPDCCGSKMVDDGDIYFMEESIVLATILCPRYDYILVKDIPISYDGKIFYERTVFKADDCRDGYNGRVILRGESRCVPGVAYNLELTPERFMQGIRTKEYRIYDEEKRPAAKLLKYPRKSIRGWLFG